MSDTPSFLESPMQQFFNTDGTPMAGGTITVYQAPGNSLSLIYATIDDALNGTNPIANPVTLNSRGEACIVLSETSKITLKDAAGNQVWSVNNVPSGTIDVASITTSLLIATTVACNLFGIGGIGTVLDGVATQAIQETGTSTGKVVTSGMQKYHPSAAKMWCVFNGTGTISILASYNVTSLTDNGTGIYAVNLSSQFSSTSYCSVGMTVGSGSVGASFTPIQLATKVDVSTFNAAGSATDLAVIEVASFGDQP